MTKIRSRPGLRWAEQLAVWMMMLSFAGIVHAACEPVGRLEFGPFDYRSAPAEKLRIVESYHFNADVEAVRKGQSSVNIGEDIEFVLRYFPNHPRALNAMIKLGKKERTDKPRGNRDSIDCWFERARGFTPDDGTVRLLSAMWFVHRGAKNEAIAQLALARASAPNNANFIYNLGLAYLDVEDYDNALQAAHQAYALGYPLPGLRDRLVRAKKWREQPVANAGEAPKPGEVPAGKAGSDPLDPAVDGASQGVQR